MFLYRIFNQQQSDALAQLLREGIHARLAVITTAMKSLSILLVVPLLGGAIADTAGGVTFSSAVSSRPLLKGESLPYM